MPSRPALDRRRLEHLAEQEGGRRLAVGAGDPGDPQLRGRVAVEARRDRRHRRPRVGDQHLRDLELGKLALDDQRRGSRLDRGGGELVPVGLLARDAEEERPRLDPAAVVGEPRDLDRAGVADDPLGLGRGGELDPVSRGDSRSEAPSAAGGGAYSAGTPRYGQGEGGDLAEGGGGDRAAVDFALRLVDDHGDQQARVLGRGEADEGGDELGLRVGAVFGDLRRFRSCRPACSRGR